MIDVQSEIDRINANSLSVGQLLECLDSPFLLVRANALLSIARQRLDSPAVIAKLGQLARERGGGRIFGTLTCDRLAVAALHWIGTTESRVAVEGIINTLDEQERNDVEHIVRNGFEGLM